MTKRAVQPIALDEPNVYGLVWRASVVAHLWWDQDVKRREALGWYLRDLRAPGAVWRLDVEPAVAELARDFDTTPSDWSEDADRLRTLTLSLALRRAEALVGETVEEPVDDSSNEPAPYEIYVRGLNVEILAIALPDLAMTAEDDSIVLHADLDPHGVARTLARVRSLGGTVVACIRSADAT